jgi:sec-independent protein translocase protein TatA
MDIGPAELIIILLIVILLFGVGRISKIAGELGSGLRAFREGLQGPEDQAAKTAAPVHSTSVSTINNQPEEPEKPQNNP